VEDIAEEDAMNWNAIQRNSNEYRRDTRQRLLALLAAQGVLTDALLATARQGTNEDQDDDVIEIEITDFEGCLGDDDDDDLDEDDDDDRN
jgi:hypothetical protein